MARGTSSNSGPAPDPNSLRALRRASVTLPSEGYDGEAPDFPFHPHIVVGDREADWWEWAWRQPQAKAWSTQSWRWVHVANWCRAQSLAEVDATAADRTALLRLAEEIGLTTAGLARNGWTIAKDEVAEKREEKPATAPSARARLAAVRDASGS